MWAPARGRRLPGIVDTFEQVAALPVERLEQLLQQGAPRERVWAAWALALRSATELPPEVARSAHEAPDPGVRRHLVVLLAGDGRREALRVLAEGDPDEHVRATACQHLARLTAPDDRAGLAFLVHRLSDPSAHVRQAALRFLPDPLVEPLGAAFARALADPEDETRHEAGHRLMQWAEEHRAPFPSALRERLDHEPDPALRGEWLAAWYAQAGPVPLLTAARGWPGPWLLQVLHLCRERHARAPWSSLEPLARRTPLEVSPLLAELLQPPLPSAARTWLATCALAGWALEAPHERATWRLTVLYTLLHALEPLSPGEPPDEERTALAALARRLREVEEEALQDHLRGCTEARHDSEACREDYFLGDVLAALRRVSG